MSYSSKDEVVKMLKAELKSITRVRDNLPPGEVRDQHDREIINISDGIKALEAQVNTLSYKPEAETR